MLRVPVISVSKTSSRNAVFLGAVPPPELALAGQLPGAGPFFIVIAGAHSAVWTGAATAAVHGFAKLARSNLLGRAVGKAARPTPPESRRWHHYCTGRGRAIGGAARTSSPRRPRMGLFRKIGRYVRRAPAQSHLVSEG